MDYYKKYEPFFNCWYIKSLIGEGGFGKVFEIERQEFGVTYKSALKIITIPQSESEIKSVMADGMDEASVITYFKNVVKDIVSEFIIMSKLKGNSNVVSYEDHVVVEHEEGIGWDILIRMELLTPLVDHVQKETLTRKDIIKLGIDICKALELCQKHNVIHRDIKPENIFISENGDYKLGDFGIARTAETTMGGLTKKGTYVYMAPEIYKGDLYDPTVDIYSLGILLYRLLNENRTPFLPPYPTPITHSDRESAIAKRINGDVIPIPANANGRLAEIVLKACAHKPSDRYSAATQMREELESTIYKTNKAKAAYPENKNSIENNSIKSNETEFNKTEEMLGAFAVPNNDSDKTEEIFPFIEESVTNKSTETDKTKKIINAFSPQNNNTKNIKPNKTKNTRGKPLNASPTNSKKKFVAGAILIATGIVVGIIAIFSLGQNVDDSAQGNLENSVNSVNTEIQVSQTLPESTPQPLQSETTSQTETPTITSMPLAMSAVPEQTQTEPTQPAQPTETEETNFETEQPTQEMPTQPTPTQEMPTPTIQQPTPTPTQNPTPRPTQRPTPQPTPVPQPPQQQTPQTQGTLELPERDPNVSPPDIHIGFD